VVGRKSRHQPLVKYVSCEWSHGSKFFYDDDNSDDDDDDDEHQY
jgi:hypothetical protein